MRPAVKVLWFIFVLFGLNFVLPELKSQTTVLDNLVVIEAENCVDESGLPVMGPKGTTSKSVFLVSNPSASGTGFISSYPSPFRVYSPLPAPVIAQTEAEIPVSGEWYMHVRYYVTPANIRKLLSSPKPPGHFKYFGPFKVIIGNHQFVCGENQQPGEEFRWDTFKINLPAGKIPVKFVMEQLSGPDCIVLTQSPDCKFQPTDYQGPLWFRFKVLKGPEIPFYILCRIHFNSYESKKPLDAGWLFKNEIATSSEQATQLMQNNLESLTIDQWSPWVKTVNPKRAFCFMHVMVMPSNPKGFPETRRAGFNNIVIEFQAATRPDENFLIHQATESSGNVRGIYVLLPHKPGLAGMKKWTKGFSEWADERLSYIKQVVKKEKKPGKIQVFTDARATVERDIDAIIESCKLAGFNGFDLAQTIIDETSLWQKIQNAGFTWTVAHHLMLINTDWKEISNMAAGTKDVQGIINRYVYEKVKERILKLLGSRPQTKREMIDLAILADEPNPQPHFLMINFIPALRACFHQYLQNQGLTPEFFGKKNWEEVDAIGIATRQSPTIENILKQFGIEIDWVQNQTNTQQDEEIAQISPVSGDGTGQKQEKKENLQRVRIPVRQNLLDATPDEKRLYYWTQKFRSYYTRQIYSQGTRVIKELSDNSWLKKNIKISPNFQAAPMMETRMWDGALNLFEWARTNTTNFLLCEDWINDPYRVGFGFSLLSASARKNNQQLGYLIVVDRNFRRRYLTGLAMGVKLFIDYFYGPLATKGPAWASSPEYAGDWCEMLQFTANCENDIVSSQLRKADTAILIANSSEINSVFYSATNFETELVGRAFGARPLFRRAGIYTALVDSQIPVEIVSEEEIIEDNTLSRYKVLYVVDTHVSTAVQQKIKEWVRNGGTLWADYIAIAKNEYDQDTNIMNEVFGLSERGTLPGVKNLPAEKGEKITILNHQALEPVSFTGSLFQPEWKLSTGKPIAVFEDGSPAAVFNKYGKGNAIIIGCSALTFSPYSTQSINNPEFEKVRKLITFAVETAGVKKHCEVNVPGISCFVRDGENQSVLFLINSTGKKQDVQVKLDVPKKLISAFDAKGEKLDFVQQDDKVIFSKTIEEDDGDICVF
ncbi:MAG TPA: beta-galactosidase trimerization domain-containing protein, partial [bacterium]|nr:beta-galactosidase trimerization domain-containing protein [bacterium]